MPQLLEAVKVGRLSRVINLWRTAPDDPINLLAMKGVPADAAYRKSVEAITKHRLDIVNKTESVSFGPPALTDSAR